ncbi:MAG: hypothetical protein R3Y67_02425 [Eubacteriales bacterium]
MMYTIVAGIAPSATEGLGLWDYGNVVLGTKSDDSMYGDLASILNSDTSIGNDDYMADLDADNIIHRYNGEMSIMNVFNTYYYETSNGDKRAEEFLQNNKIADVENAIIERAGVETIEELNKKWPSSYNFINNLKQGNGVMK